VSGETSAAALAEDASLLEAAREAARAAAEVHAEAPGGAERSGWTQKGRSDFVTEVDLEAERRIVGVLEGRFPSHRMLTEEGTDTGAARDEAGPDGSLDRIRWIIDPLDGTTNWMHGYQEYAVSVAAEDQHGLRAAVVLNSTNGELFEATRDGGARLDGEPIRTSEVSELQLALVGTGFPFKRLDLLPAYLEVLDRVLRTTSGIRRGGSAALDLCHLACGRLDAFWEFWLMPWDVAAGALIVGEAGGHFEELNVEGLGTVAGSGSDPPPVGRAGPAGGGFLGANQHLLQEFRDLVRGSER
jgi:myo-inositol-1(or 4)-monophosphatase